MFNKNENNKNRLQVNRRNFLKLAGGSAAGAFLLSQTPFLGRQFSVMAQPGGLSKFTEQLPIPPTINAAAGGIFSLPMAASTHSFHSSLPPAPTWGYGGASYLGPTFEARRGVPISVNASNLLGPHPLDFAIDPMLHGALAEDAYNPRVSLHLHGGNTEAASDGHPEDTFTPGNSKTYHYANDQEAATIWYHDHALGITRLNVYAGLAGFYLMRDDFDTGLSDNPLGLPSGQYEIPLVIQDRMFDADGKPAYPMGMFGSIWSPEFFGDVAVVNGKVFPNLDVARGLYRFRIINGSNSRVYSLRLSSEQAMYQIGGDGGLLNAPAAVTQLILAPGERADGLINFSNAKKGTKIVMTNNAATPFPDGPRAPKRGGVPLKEIMQFTVGSANGFRGSIPGKLRETPIIRLNSPVKVRNLTLVEIFDPVTGAPVKALLNNLHWHTNQIEMPKVDTVEQWNIINTTGDTHPIHLHLVQFQLLGRQKFKVGAYMAANYPGLPHPDAAGMGPFPAPSAEAFKYGAQKQPDPNEAGWKDTIRANPGEITRIMVPFGANAAPGVPFGQSFTGDYVWHCHILEHEDHEMMVPYKVVP
ncbi:MAG TPA: multicopper oxidase domain-containing protein [Pyrinomonadaceae bacterium]|nr:multicopper oxidase domain-containing protein [Pyrinomonadaceae bacterium]